jgi:hypothetical protein
VVEVINVRVKTLTGREIPLQVQQEDTILRLREFIYDYDPFGLPRHPFSLSYNGRQLQDSEWSPERYLFK